MVQVAPGVVGGRALRAYDPESLKPCHLFASRYGYRGPRIRSALFHSHRARYFDGKVFDRPVTETFAEFKYQHLKFVLGKDWWIHESQQPKDALHAIMQCAFEYHDVGNRHAPPEHQVGELFRYTPTSAVSEMLLLSDDVLRLTASGAGIPVSILERLRSRPEFHSARYELLVAGMLCRCGFRIEWLDPKLKAGEFEACDPESGERVSVEVKHRNRPGTLHAEGERPAEESLEADLDRLFKTALGQCGAATSNAIFIDANMPMDNDATGEWPYWDTVQDFLGRVPKRVDRKGEYNAFFVCVTANGWHWRPKGKVLGVPVSHGFLSPCSHVPSNPNTLIRFIAATSYPPTLPEGIYE